MTPDDIRELFSAFGPVDGAPHVRRRRHLCRRHDVRPGRDGVIYLKADEQQCARRSSGKDLPPFTYETKDGKRGVMSYRRMPERLYDDPEELATWARDALAAAQRTGVRAVKKGASGKVAGRTAASKTVRSEQRVTRKSVTKRRAKK